MGICLAVTSDDPQAALQAGSAEYPNGYLAEMCGNRLHPECGAYLDTFVEDGTTPATDGCNLLRSLPVIIPVVFIVIVLFICCIVGLIVYCCCGRAMKGRSSSTTPTEDALGAKKVDGVASA